MASPNEYDDVPMLPVSDTSSSARTRPFTSRSRSISLANTSSTTDGLNSSTVVFGNKDLPLVQMGDPLSSTHGPERPFSLPPSTGGSSDSVGASSSKPDRNHAYNRKAAQIPTPGVSVNSDSTLHNALDDDANGWGRRFITYIDKYLPRIVDPHTKNIQTRTKFFAVSLLLSIFIDPFFFYQIEVNKVYKCITINWPMAYVFLAVRSLADILFAVNILFQFRLAHVAPESRVVGAGQLVDDPIKIAKHYWRGNLKQDLFIILPLPQLLIFWIIPQVLGPSGTNDVKNILRTAILFQCIAKIHRLFHLLAGQRPTGFIFESTWANFFLNLFTFMLAGHVVGSCWYLFGLQRVNQCFRDACKSFEPSVSECKRLIDCDRRHVIPREVGSKWTDNVKAVACFQENGFPYGIYWKAVNLTHDTNLLTRYIYSLFWGFQQISTLAGNQVPSYFIWEVLFTMGIVGLGLFLFALLIGNMQNFLLALGRRNMEMTLRRRDVDQWMSHRKLPESIRTRVQDAEWLNWTATRGVNEELLIENMPYDIRRDIKQHLFAFLKNVRIFSEVDESILDAIRERLKQRTYLKNSKVLHRGGLVKKMVFIVRGKMESIGENGSRTPLLEGDVCGEELLTWCHERSSGNTDGTRIRIPSKRLRSNRDVKCVTNVEAFSLGVADLDDVMSLFPNLEIPIKS